MYPQINKTLLSCILDYCGTLWLNYNLAHIWAWAHNIVVHAQTWYSRLPHHAAGMPLQCICALLGSFGLWLELAVSCWPVSVCLSIILRFYYVTSSRNSPEAFLAPSPCGTLQLHKPLSASEVQLLQGLLWSGWTLTLGTLTLHVSVIDQPVTLQHIPASSVFLDLLPNSTSSVCGCAALKKLRKFVSRSRTCLTAATPTPAGQSRLLHRQQFSENSRS